MDPASFPWPTLSVATTGWALVFAFVTAMWKGKIVPRNSLDDAINDRNDWREDARIKDQQIAEKDRQLRYLAEVGEVQKAVLTSLDRLHRDGG